MSTFGKFIANKDLWFGFILFALGFIIRWIYILNLDITDPIRGDASSYYYYAKNLVDYGVFSRGRVGIPAPDSYWAPGYPFFLAICFKLADLFKIPFYPLVLTLQACLGGVIVGVTYFVGRYFLPALAAIISALLTALSPHLNSLGGNFLSETLFTFMLLLVIYTYVSVASSSRESPWKWGLCGLLFGLTYLVNPIVLFIPLLLIVFYALKQNRKKILTVLKVGIPFLGCFLLVVAAWMLRDLKNVSPENESSADRAFQNLIIGSHSEYHSVWKANILEGRKGGNPADIEIEKYQDNRKAFLGVLIDRMFNEPLHYLRWYLWQKPAEFWGWNILAGDGDIYQYPVNSSVYHKSKPALLSFVLMKQSHMWLVWAAFLGGIWLLTKKDRDQNWVVLTLYVPLCYMTFMYVVLHTDGRYSVPLRPEMYLCAVYAIHKLVVFINEAKAKNR